MFNQKKSGSYLSCKARFGVPHVEVRERKRTWTSVWGSKHFELSWSKLFLPFVWERPQSSSHHVSSQASGIDFHTKVAAGGVWLFLNHVSWFFHLLDGQQLGLSQHDYYNVLMIYRTIYSYYKCVNSILSIAKYKYVKKEKKHSDLIAGVYVLLQYLAAGTLSSQCSLALLVHLTHALIASFSVYSPRSEYPW